METRAVRARVANACDTCKLRKIKCSGRAPCAYCVRRREPDNCRFTAGRRRPPARPRHDDGSLIAATSTHNNVTLGSPASETNSGVAQLPSLLPQHHHHQQQQHHHHHHRTASPASSQIHITATSVPPPSSISRSHSLPEIIHGTARQPQPQPPTSSDPVFEEHEHEETEVPREARLLCDAQGKLIFIGDCAPLSFFQTVRRLVTSRVDPHAFAPETGGYSALENVSSSRPTARSAGPPPITCLIKTTVQAYLDVTSGFVDLFDSSALPQTIEAWAEQDKDKRDAASAAHYLVLAIGCQASDEEGPLAAAGQEYFDYARDLAFASLTSGDLGVATVQVFILVTLYSLGACQINAGFLFFGIAARAAYSIGIHRTAVNARFGGEVHELRDNVWKSLKVLDLYLSASMGRPPATSDVDCTVPYRGSEGEDGREIFNLLNASVQIFLVIESVVTEVYSRRKISPRLTEGISKELRDWSSRWLSRLKDVVEGRGGGGAGMANGVCQVLASYYYAVVLVSRPFLMVELHRRLAVGGRSPGSSGGGEGSSSSSSGKSKLADACIDAAILMVETVKGLIERGMMTRRAPMVVSWLFASSLVLGAGLLGGFGHIIEKHCRAAISALDYFAQADAHAVQYSLIAKSLLATALEYLEKREMQERLRRTESSSRIFGLIPRTTSEGRPATGSPSVDDTTKGFTGGDKARIPQTDGPTPGLFGFDFEAAFLGLTDSFERTPDFSMMGMGGGSFGHETEQTFGALNLFPLLEGDGHIDLANYF